jgi:Tfp pilus assembly protein PilX
VLVGLDPMSVPGRRAHVEHAVTGDRASFLVGELKAEQQRARSIRHDERGIALVMALGFLVVVSIVVFSALDYTTANGRNGRYNVARQQVDALAQAGVNNAEAVLSNPSNNALTPTLLPSTTTTYDGGTVTWSGTLNQANSTWTITSTGNANNPSGAATVTRTLTATILVSPTLTQPLNNQAWNYVYDWGTGNTCDMSLGNSVNVNSPLYVDGNLCMSNSATITKGPLNVKGRLTMNQNGNSVGSSGSYISDAHIANGCNFRGTLYNPCVVGASDHVYATVLNSSPANISPPSIDFDGWYANANPGPKFPCYAPNSSASNTWPVFENETTNPTRNNSVPTSWNLTPATSYDCWTDGGEIGWNASTKVLTIRGVIFIDGSAYSSNGAANSYTGQGTLYLSGSLTISNNTFLCAVVSGSACDTANWNPNTRLLVVVTNGSGNGVSFTQNGGFQGGAYATNTINIGNGFNMDGPLVAQTVSLGQSVGSSFPFINIVPQGTPGNPNTYAQPQAPSYGG